MGGIGVIDQGEEDGGGDGIIGDTVDDTAIRREGLSLSGELSIGAIEDEAKEDEDSGDSGVEVEVIEESGEEAGEEAEE